ncbi:(2Fe-2S)-binding protein [Fonticella tunisiensis]|uniref:Carbon-monoxide dehydrogenase small subunit n=1 Tax=Fonticella tunisiensis TaxID=1096341 RepID=A0A4R7KUB7_9CLOT|nr:(2Fe-2S)-binding protein [Fonticella tunisiensis]TDT63663.1 carbon-monoxide dehydrogenase small subunit [Fonticella tunisiensis]
MKINLKINNINRDIDVEPGEVLYDVLRRCGFTSIKKACGTSSCGVCTVLLDGMPVPSCSYLAVKADGHNITTIEGIKEEADRIGKFMVEEGAVQCGFCSPGFLLTVIAMEREIENPDSQGIKNYLAGNLCRCSGYEGQLRAVKKYMGVSE